MVRIHREPPVEGPPGGAVAYTHFGARLARPDRFDSSVTHQILRDWQIGICTRLLSETKWVRFPHPAPRATTRRHSITDQCSELLPRTMRVQISLPLPMWGCGPTDEGARLRTLRSEFNSLHPLHIIFRLAWSKA